MSNLLVEIGNTALKAAWSDRMTLGKTFRYQGEKYLEFILSLTRKEKPAVMVVSCAFSLPEQEKSVLREECTSLLILDSGNKEWLIAHGLPSYLSYDRAASILAAVTFSRARAAPSWISEPPFPSISSARTDSIRAETISLGCRTRFKALSRYSRSLPLWTSRKILL